MDKIGHYELICKNKNFANVSDTFGPKNSHSFPLCSTKFFTHLKKLKFTCHHYTLFLVELSDLIHTLPKIMHIIK